MFADQSKASMLSRGGPAIAVIGLHILLIYGLMVSVGFVEIPRVSTPIQAIFIDEPDTAEPEPELPQVKPDIENLIPVDEPLPEIPFEEPIAPPTDIVAPSSDSAISAAAAPGTVAQELKTKNRVDPVYPPTSRRLGEAGTVRLKVLVDERGRPRDVEVAKSSGFERLDAAAIEAVRRWRFVAATDGTNAITAWTQVAVTFKLTS